MSTKLGAHQRKVIAAGQTGEDFIYEVTVSTKDSSKTETFRTTELHPFWSDDVLESNNKDLLSDNWVAASDLKPGDRLRLADGNAAFVVSVVRTEVTEPVYNFTVEGFHTYHVGELGVWVHNTGCFNPPNIKDVKFGDFNTHYGKHAELLGVKSKPAYKQQAYDNMTTGKGFNFHHNGEAKRAAITRTNDGGIMFTSSTPSGNRMFTHMKIEAGQATNYLSNIGITLPDGF